MRALRALAILSTLWLAFNATALRASDYDRLEIRLNSIANRGFWFDVELGLGARPDFQATLTVVGGDATERVCQSARFENMESVSPNQLLCTVVVRKPYRVILHLVDHDVVDHVPSEQVADLDPAGAGLDFVGPLVDQTLLTSTFTTPGDVAVTFNVSARPVVPTLRFDAISAPNYTSGFPSHPLIDPAAGHSLSFSGAISPGGQVRLAIIPKHGAPSPINDELRFALEAISNIPIGFISGSFTFSFDGMVTDYFAYPIPKVVAVPPGVYVAKFTHLLPDGDTVQSVSREFEIATVTRPELSSWSVPKKIDVDAEPFLIRFSSTRAGTATVVIFTRGWTTSDCSVDYMGAPPEKDPSDGQFPPERDPNAVQFESAISRGLNEIRWEGLLVPGFYCIAIRGKTHDGQVFRGVVFSSFEVTPLPQPGLVVTTRPISPALQRRTGVVEATAVNGLFRSAPAKKIELFVGHYTGPGSPAPQLAKVCMGVRTCSTEIPFNVGTVAYEARMSNRLGTYSTGVRLTDVAWSNFTGTYRLSAAAECLPEDASLIRELKRNQTVDISFHAGDGYALDREPQLTTFANRLKEEVQTLFGAGNSARSSVFNDVGSVSFFVSSVPAQVTQAGFNFGACLRTAPNLVSFIDVNAVLHPKLACRDYASGSIYTGESARVSWHEFHHIAFGLADEYCQDTPGHYQPSQFPNLYAGLSRCQALSSNPSSCKSIADPANCLGGRCTCDAGFFKSDPGRADVLDFSDVMNDNTLERPDDLRAARGKFAACKVGEC